MHVVGQTRYQHRILGGIGIEGAEDPCLGVVRRRQAVVDGGGEAVRGAAPQILVNLQRPVAHALAADADIGGSRRGGHGNRRAAERLQAGLQSSGGHP
jgi:hypothetical protein